MIILAAIIIAMVMYLIVHNQKMMNGTDKRFVILTWKSSAGVIYDKKRTGKAEAHLTLDGRIVSRGMPIIGMFLLVLLLLTYSTHSLKIENEEGEVLSKASMEIIEYQSNASRPMGDDLWDIAKKVAKGVSQIFPQMHDDNVPGRTTQLEKEIDELGK